jgi:hypothetical protein
MGRRPKVLGWFPVGVLVVGLIAGCSSSPTEPPSAATVALEPSLLTIDDVGGDFEVEGRDQFEASSDVVVSFCPDSDFECTEVGGADVRFMWPTDDPDPMTLFETLRIVESVRNRQARASDTPGAVRCWWVSRPKLEARTDQELVIPDVNRCEPQWPNRRTPAHQDVVERFENPDQSPYP